MTTSMSDHHEFSKRAPDGSVHGLPSWCATAANLAVVVSRVTAGSLIEVPNEPDESAVLVVGGSADVRVETADDAVTAQPHSLVIAPPGGHWITALTDGYLYRVFSKLSPTYARCNELAPASVNIEASDLVQGPEPIDGYRLRHYRLSDYADQNLMLHGFVTRSLMFSIVQPQDVARSPTTLSPHLHDDFQQISLVTLGTWVHHLRRAWGPDRTAWVADEHVTVESPAVSVIHAPDIHTSQSIGKGPYQIVDLFAPARTDPAFRGVVLNAAEYGRAEPA